MSNRDRGALQGGPDGNSEPQPKRGHGRGPPPAEDELTRRFKAGLEAHAGAARMRKRPGTAGSQGSKLQMLDAGQEMEAVGHEAGALARITEDIFREAARPGRRPSLEGRGCRACCALAARLDEVLGGGIPPEATSCCSTARRAP
ncbi:MAG: hypothetical protein MZV70_43760 [Desulfobacterales bacterium]|nr:hypothetical protein [Desulfobacterales bacterium]